MTPKLIFGERAPQKMFLSKPSLSAKTSFSEKLATAQ